MRSGPFPFGSASIITFDFLAEESGRILFQTRTGVLTSCKSLCVGTPPALRTKFRLI